MDLLKHEGRLGLNRIRGGKFFIMFPPPDVVLCDRPLK